MADEVYNRAVKHAKTLWAKVARDLPLGSAESEATALTTWPDELLRPKLARLMESAHRSAIDHDILEWLAVHELRRLPDASQAMLSRWFNDTPSRPRGRRGMGGQEGIIRALVDSVARNFPGLKKSSGYRKFGGNPRSVYDAVGEAIVKSPSGVERAVRRRQGKK